MTPQEHYDEAERLLAEGEKVVGVISDLAMKRASFTATKPVGGLGVLDAARVDELTARMDEKGKKAMGIWAQAQVHATLATVPPGLGRG